MKKTASKNTNINKKFSDGLEFVPDIGRKNELGEVFTPYPIVKKMLGEAKIHLTRSDSLIIEPASGHGNFGVEILDLKIKSVIREMYCENISESKWTTEYEIRTIIALGSLYQNDIDFQNIEELKGRLSRFVMNRYKKFARNPQKTIPTRYDIAVSSILSTNCIVCDFLSGNMERTPICFYKRSKKAKTKILRVVKLMRDIKNSSQDEPSLFDDPQDGIVAFDEIYFNEWKQKIGESFDINRK